MNRLKLGDRKCLPDPRRSFIAHPDAFYFCEFCEKEFFNSHAWFRKLTGPVSQLGFRFWITVAVGTTITDRPPAQIRTSASTHTALTKDEWRRSVHRDRGAERGVEESTGLRLW